MSKKIEKLWLPLIINKETGRPPTKKEMKELKKRAIEICRSPYSSPEQLEWALNIYPEGIGEILEGELWKN